MRAALRLLQSRSLELSWPEMTQILAWKRTVAHWRSREMHVNQETWVLISAVVLRPCDIESLFLNCLSPWAQLSVKVCWLDSFSKRKSPDYGLAGARRQESRQCWARGLSFPPSLSPLGLLMSPLPLLPPPGWEIVLVLVTPQWVWGICVRPGNPPQPSFQWMLFSGDVQPLASPMRPCRCGNRPLPAAGSETRAVRCVRHWAWAFVHLPLPGVSSF